MFGVPTAGFVATESFESLHHFVTQEPRGVADVAFLPHSPVQISARKGHLTAKDGRRDRNGPVLGETADVGNTVEQQPLSRLVHLRGRLLEPEVQQVSLTPAGGRAGGFLVLAAAEDFDVRILVEPVRIGAPTRAPLLLGVANQRKHFDRGIGFWRSKRLGSCSRDHRLGFDGEWLAENDVLA